jgi:small subunit ribosomal protein S9
MPKTTKETKVKKEVKKKTKEVKVVKVKKEKVVKEPKVEVKEVAQEVQEEIKPVIEETVEVKEEVKIEEPETGEPKKVKPLKKGFITGMGRRKEAKAGVFMWDAKGEFIVNGMPIEKYFSSDVDQVKWVRPFHAVGVSHPEARYSASVKVLGSGKSSQMDAVVLAFAKALSKLDPEFDKILRKQGYLTRDSRMVERKKPFLHKARKRPQYSKR